MASRLLKKYLAERDAEDLASLRAEVKKLAADKRQLLARQGVEDRIVGHARLALDAMPTVRAPRALTKKQIGGRTTESLVLLASDWHAGEVVDADEMGGLNAYDFNVFVARLQHLVAKCLHFTTENMAQHVFEELHVVMLGDMVSGIIHEEFAETNCLTIGEQATLTALVSAQALLELAQAFPHVVVTCVVGNHGRTSKKPRFKHRAATNWDWICYNYMALLVRQQRNITFRVPAAYWCGVEIQGHRFHIAHGDQIRGWAGFPFYGAARETAAWVEIGASKQQFFEYFLRAHFHTTMELQRAVGATIFNGSLIGGNEYALGIPAFAVPQQLMFGVHQEHGKTWSLPIDCQHAAGPVRYKWQSDLSLAEQARVMA